MKIEEVKNCFFIKNFFLPPVVAGFTKASISGRLPSGFQALLSYMGRRADFCYMNQKHLPIISLADEPGAYDADGLFSEKKSIFLVVKTADCLPILLAGRNRRAGIIHMGWRSAKKGILKNIPFDLSGFQAFAGVGLRRCCYRVGDEFLEYPEFSFCLKKSPQGLFFDPVKFAKINLVNLGMEEDNFFDLGICSLCSQGPFFSWRRDQTANRTLSFIGS